ncbi:hypothetical protein CCP3SC15_2200001 [Gammaproteobacteria bacterium]
MRPRSIDDFHSHARHWRDLTEEIHDALTDAIHHPRVLDCTQWPELWVEITPRLLPRDNRDPDMLGLHYWLVRQDLDFGQLKRAVLKNAG